jgi:hypothetical protein
MTLTELPGPPRATLPRLAALCLSVGVSVGLWSAPSHAAEPSATQQALVDQVMALWHAENVVLVMVQRPASDALQQARIALQGRVSADKRDAALKEMAPDAQRYIDEATPLAQAAARRQLPATVGATLASQFSEDELRQLVALLESPVKKKFEQLAPQMERALGDKVSEEAGPAIQPKLDAMKQAIGLKLRAAAMLP